MSIKVFYEGTKYRFRGWKKICKILEKVIRSENKTLGDLNFIITNDQYMLEINREFLKHNYFTDVIAFGGSADGKVNGEVYISKDCVKSNSINYNVSLEDEMVRVVIHGLLHLLGYEDRDQEEKSEMHKLEDKWLNEFHRV